MGSNKPNIGKYFGNYRIAAIIACGGFGCVYRAYHEFLPRTVAIKLLHAHLYSEDARDKFLQEAQLLERLKHPRILQIYEFGIDDDLPYIVTEYASGGSLRNLLQQRSYNPLPVGKAVAIVSQIGDALYYAHQHGVIHHDLKPENILFNKRGEVLLADFGISIVRATSTLQQVTELNGTPAYMAPEQFRGSVSLKSDQYSLGCILYELVTGRKPFTAPDAISMGLKHMQELPSPPTRWNPDLPPMVEFIILKALEKRRINRYPDILSFIQELQTFSNTYMHISTERRANSLIHARITREQYLNEGVQFYSIGRYKEALAAFDQALNLDPYFIDAHFGKGNTLYFMRRYEEALLAFERAIHLAPRNAAFHTNKGSTLYSLGRCREALASYERAIQLDPYRVSAQRGRNLALRCLGRVR